MQGPTNKTDRTMGTPRRGTRRAVVGYIFLGLLSVQFGIQPLLYKTFASNVQHPFTLVIACEICKFLIASIILATSGRFSSNAKSWRFIESLRYSGIPACTYAIQNSLVLISYQNLPPLLFNLLNQTKLLWTALFVYMLLGKRFSSVQCFSMLLLSAAALSLSQEKELPTKDADLSSVIQTSSPSFRLGVIPLIFASILSGLGAALTQRSMQIYSRDTALVTMELSIYGTCFVLFQKLISSYVRTATIEDGSISFTGWNIYTLLPVLCNAVGGLLVGVVTKYAGGVLKSFALVGGIICTALVESVAYEKELSFETWVAAFLVGISLMLYSAFPHQEKIISKII